MSGQQPSNEKKPPVTEPKVSNDEKNLVVSFIQFLHHKVSSNHCTEDQIEGLEVAVQCLETAFNVSDLNYAFQPSKPLLDIFVAAEGLAQTQEQFLTPTAAEVEQANKLKEEGNELVKASKLDEAIQKYNEAIKLNRDPIYFCNRAAAYCRQEQFDLAIQDCRTALALEPNYAKAYGRMGVALSCQNRYDQAVEAYKKALEIDPNNESYKQNLNIAQDKLKEAEAAYAQNPEASGLPFMPPGLGNLLNNPQMMQMASQMMSNPEVQNVMTQMMGSIIGGAGGGAAADGNQPNFENLLRAGESLAHRMNQANPELVEQLRRQFASSTGANNENENRDQDGNNPPQNDGNQ